MGYSDSITRSLEELKNKARDFNMLVSSIDGNFDSKLGEIKALELKRDKLREEVDKTHNKATSILQEAHDQASKVRKEASLYMEEAQNLKQEARKEKEEAQRDKAVAQSLLNQANEKQRDADKQWHLIEAKQRKLEEAIRG